MTIRTYPVLPRNRAQRQARIAATLRTLGVSYSDACEGIERTLAQASPLERQDGAAWYGAAQAIALDVGTRLGASDADAIRLGAAIIACLSPQTSWDENIVRAYAYAAGATLLTPADQTRKLAALRLGEAPLSVLGGRKVRSFYRNIIGQHSAVTVDRHAVAIVIGHAASDKEVKVLERIGAYVVIAAAYRTVARRYGIAPSTLQAITWLAWRRLKSSPAHDEEF